MFVQIRSRIWTPGRHDSMPGLHATTLRSDAFGVGKDQSSETIMAKEIALYINDFADSDNWGASPLVVSLGDTVTREAAKAPSAWYNTAMIF
jgi:hypothetical protein